MDAVSIRGDWVGQIIDGRFPLLEWRGGSGGSGVFRTEPTGSASQAAIKLIPASARAEERLAVWKSAASLSHPHLLRIHHFGRAQIGDTGFVYIVTDLADEVLSQIIPERPLTAVETRELLDPLLDALGYLHRHGFVHGHLKPANILVVENEIKLSSDCLLSIGDFASDHLGNDIHVAPETARSPVAPPADIWSLGITMVEALTQEPPIWDAVGNAEPVVPASLLEPFLTVARGCLHPDPARRSTLRDIVEMLEGRPKASASRPSQHSAQQANRPTNKAVPAKFPFLPLLIGLVLLVAIVAALRIRSHQTETAPVQTEATQQARPAEPEAQPAPQPPATQPASAPAGTSPETSATPPQTSAASPPAAA